MDKKKFMSLLFSVAATTGCSGQPTDVYITIHEQYAERGWIARLWKNGAIQDLGERSLSSFAYPVFVK